MLKNMLLAIFIVVFTIFTLDYFKLLPSDRVLGFKNISYRQQEEINSFSVIEKPQESKKFTDRVANQNKLY
jgi:hypothetical protein